MVNDVMLSMLCFDVVVEADLGKGEAYNVVLMLGFCLLFFERVLCHTRSSFGVGCIFSHIAAFCSCAFVVLCEARTVLDDFICWGYWKTNNLSMSSVLTQQK